jgi:pilus assembly protein Flp/PilA
MLSLYADYVARKGCVLGKVKALIPDKSGATAIEYGLIAALISIVILGALTAIGTSLNTTFQSVHSGIN